MSAPCQNSFLLNEIHLDYVLRYHTFIVYQIFNFACSIFACQPVTLSTRANALEIRLLTTTSLLTAVASTVAAHKFQ